MCIMCMLMYIYQDYMSIYHMMTYDVYVCFVDIPHLTYDFFILSNLLSTSFFLLSRPGPWQSKA